MIVRWKVQSCLDMYSQRSYRRLILIFGVSVYRCIFFYFAKMFLASQSIMHFLFGALHLCDHNQIFLTKSFKPCCSLLCLTWWLLYFGIYVRFQL